MNYFLIGDQGISMRGIKQYLESMGHKVSGSDLKTTGHKAENITGDIDVIVRTSAVSPGSPGWVEVEQAKKLGIRVMKRSELLRELTKDKRVIAVSGMHGKTTVTSMAGLCLSAGGLDPTVLIGEELEDFGGVLRIGRSDWFVMEACEYDRAFLDFYPQILILTNIEEEHLDTYPGGLPEIKEAFRQYINHVPDDGEIIAPSDDENVKDVLSRCETKAKIIYYGISSEKYNELGYGLSVPGNHNIANALAIVALGDLLEIKQEKIKATLQKFKGARRRFEFKGNYNGADIIDDYGHHPTEINATLNALEEKYKGKKKVVVFWPHQYKRIKPFLNQFAEVFKKADEVILKPIFLVPGRDELLKVSSNDLVDLINKNKKIAQVIDTDEKILDYLKTKLNKDSVLLTIGIPPVYKIADKLSEKEAI